MIIKAGTGSTIANGGIAYLSGGDSAGTFGGGGVVLTGGTSLFASLRDRLEREMTETAPSMMKVKVAAATNSVERRYSTWIGGSILASLGTFQQMWMSKEEYKEHGAGLIHKKAP